MNNESEDIKVEPGSWEDLIIQEMPEDNSSNQLRALDTDFK